MSFETTGKLYREPKTEATKWIIDTSKLATASGRLRSVTAYYVTYKLFSAPVLSGKPHIMSAHNHENENGDTHRAYNARRKPTER